MLGSPALRKRPLSEDDIKACLNRYSSSSYDDSLFCALLLAGFLGLHRLGELVRASRGDAWRKAIPRSSASLNTAERYFQYTLPTSKTDHVFEGSRIIIAEHIESVRSFDLFATYLAERDRRFPLSPPLWITESGQLPSRDWFLNRLQAVVQDPTVGGHSLRAGGATFFASLGWPDDRIQHLGRWQSSAFKIYIRKNPVVLNALMLGRSRRA